MPAPDRRWRPRALAAPLTLVTAVMSFAPLAAGARLVVHGGSAPSVSRAVAGGTGAVHGLPKPAVVGGTGAVHGHPKPAVASGAGAVHGHPKPVVVGGTSAVHGHPKPVLPVAAASAASAVYEPKWAPVHAPEPHHARHRSPAPKPHRRARQRQASSPRSQALVRHQLHTPALMLLNRAVLDMEAAGPSRTVLDLLNHRQNLVSTPLAQAKPLTNTTRIQVFSSYAGIAQAIAGHQIAADTRAVVYDNELSTGTPSSELKDPVRYCRLTARLLHRNGLEYIASPGFDLSGPRPANGEWFRQFARAGLMACGRYADYLDIQDQLMQGTSTYVRDAQAAATLLHQINPRARLLMGLSASPSGLLATAGQLWRAYRDTSRFVTGYWLNLPHNVSGHSLPSVALGFLQKVAARTS